MNLTKKKKQIITKLSTIGTTLTLLAIKSNVCFAEGGIGTQEVQTATDNIKRVITSIAMPLGRYLNFCKYCCSSTQDDCKCKQSAKKS